MEIEEKEIGKAISEIDCTYYKTVHTVQNLKTCFFELNTTLLRRLAISRGIYILLEVLMTWALKSIEFRIE